MHQIVECADYFLDISELSEPQYERIQNELLLREICIDELGSKVTVKDIQHMLSLSGFKLTRYLVGNYDYKYIIQRYGLRDIKGGKYPCNLYKKKNFRLSLKSYIPGIRLKIFSFQKIIDKLRRIIKQTDNRMIKEKAYKLIFSIRLYQYTYLEKGVNVGPKHVRNTDSDKFKKTFTLPLMNMFIWMNCLINIKIRFFIDGLLISFPFLLKTLNTIFFHLMNKILMRN